MATKDDILRSALRLSPDERQELIHDLAVSLEDEAPEDPVVVKEAWDREILRRLDEVKSGKVRTIPAEEVFRDMHRRVAKTRKTARRK